MTAEVPRDAVLAYTDDRHEEEILCRPETAERLPLSSAELAEHARRRTEAAEAHQANLWRQVKLSRK
jgi:hypothetical protein